MFGGVTIDEKNHIDCVNDLDRVNNVYLFQCYHNTIVSCEVFSN